MLHPISLPPDVDDGAVGARRSTTIPTRPRRQTLGASGRRRGAITRGASSGIGAANDAGHPTIDLLMCGPFEQNLWPANVQVDSCYWVKIGHLALMPAAALSGVTPQLSCGVQSCSGVLCIAYVFGD